MLSVPGCAPVYNFNSCSVVFCQNGSMSPAPLLPPKPWPQPTEPVNLDTDMDMFLSSRMLYITDVAISNYNITLSN